MLEEGCALRPPPHTGSGKAGRGVSLPFIPVRREVTAFWGWAQRGHRKEAEGSRSMCSVSYCWACGFSPPPLLNTNQNPSWEDKDRSYCCSCGNTPMAWAATAQPAESEALLAARWHPSIKPSKGSVSFFSSSCLTAVPLWWAGPGSWGIDMDHEPGMWSHSCSQQRCMEEELRRHPMALSLAGHSKML